MGKFLIISQGESHHVLGALTINSGGSISFFPDTYPEQATSHKVDQLLGDCKSYIFPDYDHMTLTRDFLKTGGHVTSVSEKKRKKLDKHKVNALPDGTHHWLSLVVSNLSYLNDAPIEITLPIFKIEESLSSAHSQMLTESIKDFFLRIRFPEEIREGTMGCVQFVLVKKGTHADKCYYGQPFKTKVLGNPEIPSETLVADLLIKTEDKQEYDIIVKSFVLKGSCAKALYIIKLDESFV